MCANATPPHTHTQYLVRIEIWKTDFQAIELFCCDKPNSVLRWISNQKRNSFFYNWTKPHPWYQTRKSSTLQGYPSPQQSCVGAWTLYWFVQRHFLLSAYTMSLDVYSMRSLFPFILSSRGLKVIAHVFYGYQCHHTHTYIHTMPWLILSHSFYFQCPPP